MIISEQISKLIGPLSYFLGYSINDLERDSYKTFYVPKISKLIHSLVAVKNSMPNILFFEDLALTTIKKALFETLNKRNIRSYKVEHQRGNGYSFIEVTFEMMNFQYSRGVPGRDSFESFCIDLLYEPTSIDDTTRSILLGD